MKDDYQPVMALNPYSSKLMNVEPLFRFIEDEGVDSAGIDDIIKHIILNDDSESVFLSNEFKDRQSMFIYLYALREMFQKLAQCEISIPKK